jgi:hypothetical protein
MDVFGGLFGPRLGVMGKQPSPCSPSFHLGGRGGGGKSEQSSVEALLLRKGWASDRFDLTDRRVPVDVFRVKADRRVERDPLRGTVRSAA